MLHIMNDSGFQTMLVPALDRDGNEHIAILIKGTFLVGSSGGLERADEQLPIVVADSYFEMDRPGSIKYESELCHWKPTTDIVVLGHAYCGSGEASSCEARLEVGTLVHRVLVMGDRCWRGQAGVYRPTAAKSFRRLALRYERSFGGTAQGDNPELFDIRNPIGIGFTQGRRFQNLDGLPLPNFEDATNPITSYNDRPRPMGFGYIGRNWEPRRSFAGTTDKSWERERSPLLPIDFDERYYNGAHPSLQTKSYLEGTEIFQLTNLYPDGIWRFELPRLLLCIEIAIAGNKEMRNAALDTVIIEPDENRISLIWRASFLCTRKFLQIDRIHIRTRGI